MLHKYYLNGCHIVLDVNSGAVHAVDELFYRLIDYVSFPLGDACPRAALSELSCLGSREDILEAYSELSELYRAGQLGAADEYEGYADLMTAAPVKSMCLNIAHDCNLRCEYCFAAQGDFGTGRKLMPFETARAAIDFLIRSSAGRRNLEVDFFGGEPLMNFETVRRTVEYARSIEGEHGKNFRFTITTNGLLLDDESIGFINREMSNVVLSIDGRPQINDALRRRVNGSGCYDAILPKYKRLVAGRGGGEYYVRGTFTKLNPDFTNDVTHLLDAGFDRISIEPVMADAKFPYALTEEDLPRIFEEYETLAKEIIRRRRAGERFTFFHFMLDLDAGPCAIKRLRGCSCGNEYIAVTPEGDIYPCHQFVGTEGWKMGNVSDGTFDEDMKRRFSKVNIYAKEKCRGCWAKFYCSGGCSASNAEYAGDILTPHAMSCEIEKKRLECAIMIKALLS